ncbi:hypothetical protein HYW44_00695 [Candidatus Daviesbacteria bacterium]|nr:hypothetical protein [Candidatus Daviesbacteria bacterium]
MSWEFKPMRKGILKQELILSEFQKQVLIGYLLGDGHLETWGNSKVARLKVEQSLEQREFVSWLFEVFGEFVKTPPKFKAKSIYFNSLSSKQFFIFHKMFYPNGKKVIPYDIETLLTPISLTIWFMGDGSIKSKECNGRILNTHGFTKNEIQKVIQTLSQKFSLQASIRRQKDGLQIYISAKSAGKLYQILFPHLLPSFYYKLPKV